MRVFAANMPLAERASMTSKGGFLARLRTHAAGHKRALQDGWFRAAQFMSWAKLLRRVFEIDMEP